MGESSLVVELKADPDDVDTWELTVRVAYQGYSGESSCYLSGNQVREAAHCMARYPLPDDGGTTIEGGYGVANEPGVKHVLVHLSLVPVSVLGDLALHVVLAKDPPSGRRAEAARLELQIPLEYEQAAKLSQGLLSLIGKNARSFKLQLE